ncbi:MAG: PDZ domain-containing protein [Anaerolineales bacterium]|nr:PDZ domain-containing protein [Anaerolineales bacterium]
MASLKRKLLIVVFVFFSLSCQAVTLFRNAEFLVDRITAPTPIGDGMAGTPSPEVEFIASSAAPIPVTQAPIVSPTITVTPSAFQVRIFNELWQIVRDEYLYPDFNGLNWDAIYVEYSVRIGTGLYPEEFYQAMSEMISRLGDDHSFFLSPNQVAEEEAQFAGVHDYVGIGVLISAVPEKGKAVILATIPDSPAELAGLQPRDSILAIDGEPILDEDGTLREIIRGPEGSEVTITVHSPGQEIREVIITRSAISGVLPMPHSILISNSGKRIGYVFLTTFADYTVESQIVDAMNEMTAEGPLDGLILDNRFNPGGINTVMQNVLSFFTSGDLGYFISRHEERLFQIQGQDINGSQTVPLVVLISPETESYGEVFAGILKDNQRAHLIGEPTSGNIETLWGYDFDDGSRAWIAYETFRPYHNPQEDWEKIGINPDNIVVSEWSEVTMENDAVIQAALTYFEQTE